MMMRLFLFALAALSLGGCATYDDAYGYGRPVVNYGQPVYYGQSTYGQSYYGQPQILAPIPGYINCPGGGRATRYELCGPSSGASQYQNYGYPRGYYAPQPNYSSRPQQYQPMRCPANYYLDRGRCIPNGHDSYYNPRSREWSYAPPPRYERQSRGQPARQTRTPYDYNRGQQQARTVERRQMRNDSGQSRTVERRQPRNDSSRDRRRRND